MYIFFKPKDKIYFHVLIVNHIKKLPHNYVLTKKMKRNCENQIKIENLKF